MEFCIVELTSHDSIARCATIMVNSDPWAVLAPYTERACAAALADEAISVHGVVREPGDILGFLGAMPKGMAGEPLLEYLCVNEAYRNSGLGTALVRYFEDTLFSGADNLYVYVSDINPHARRLYCRLGYGQIGALADYNRPGQTEFIYRKTRRARTLTTPGGLGAPAGLTGTDHRRAT